jgi:hypothetical protein
MIIGGISMGIFETYSKRMLKIKKQGIIDVYKYDELQQTLRRQIIFIWKDAIGWENSEWELIHNTMARELGVSHLGRGGNSFFGACQDFMLNTKTEEAIDFIEISFRFIDKCMREISPYDKSRLRLKQEPDDAIKELNYRFKEHGVGYEYINTKIIRIDNEFIHHESVKPAIRLLYDEDFEGASNEFFKSYEHFRKGKYKEAIAEALKSFVSTMKTICEKKKYSYDITENTASTLISILTSNELIPAYLTTHFTNLRTTLEAELPTVRNKTRGHGHGISTIAIPEYFASYAINLTATNIVFLINAYNQNK